MSYISTIYSITFNYTNDTYFMSIYVKKERWLFNEFYLKKWNLTYTVLMKGFNFILVWMIFLASLKDLC